MATSQRPFGAEPPFSAVGALQRAAPRYTTTQIQSLFAASPLGMYAMAGPRTTTPETYFQAARLAASHGTGELSFLGAGAENVAFDIGNEKVLKFRHATLSYGEHQQPIPPVSHVLQPLASSSDDFVHIFPKVDHLFEDTSQEGAQLAARLKEDMAASGWNWHDANPRNVGVYQGQPKIIDAGFIDKIDPEAIPHRPINLDHLAPPIDTLAISKRLMNSNEAHAGTGTFRKLVRGARRMAAHL
jgi:hypothetical protein